MAGNLFSTAIVPFSEASVITLAWGSSAEGFIFFCQLINSLFRSLGQLARFARWSASSSAFLLPIQSSLRLTNGTNKQKKIVEMRFIIHTEPQNAMSRPTAYSWTQLERKHMDELVICIVSWSNRRSLVLVSCAIYIPPNYCYCYSKHSHQQWKVGWRNEKGESFVLCIWSEVHYMRRV